MKIARAARESGLPVLHSLLALIPSDWPRDEFVLCGSAALAVRGIRDVHDLDVMIDPALWDETHALVREHGEKEHFERYAVGSTTEPRLVRLGCEIDIWDEHPRIANVADFARTLVCADLFEIQGRAVNVLSLRHTLAIKALAMVPGRSKDLQDMMYLARAIDAEEQPGYLHGPPAWHAPAVPPPPPVAQ